MYININRAFRILVAALALTAGGTAAVSAQDYVNTPVSISKEKVRINGKVCYSHVVLEKQTLFSISKAYNVSLDDIYKFNPTLKETGLIKNSIIIIPSVGTEAETVQENEPAKDPVAVEEAAEETVKPEAKQDSPKKKKKKVHTVKWYENIDDIASRYGVSVEEIMAANNLEGRKLKSRMKLTIPEPGEYSAEAIALHTLENQADTLAVVSTEPQTDTTVVQDEPSFWPFTKNEKVAATLLLPFKANGTSGSRSNMDFYSGVLLAINDLGQAGTSTDLSVFDISDSNFDMGGCRLEDTDLIIGPVSVTELNKALTESEGRPTVISPLDPKAENLTVNHRNMVQAPTPHKVQYDDLASWIKEETIPEDVVLLISEKGARPTEANLEMRQSIETAGVEYRTFSYSILEGRDVMNPLKGIMTQTGTNRVLITSESEAFVNDVVRNLNLMLHQKYNVVLYGASKIRSFETIEVENFHKTNLHVSLTYYIDYNEQKVKNFLLKYRALFNAEPTQFAFQGYDIASYFIEMRSKYGRNWMDRLSSEERSLLQSTFRCVKKEDGGYTNHGVRRIVYEKDWTISKVR